MKIRKGFRLRIVIVLGLFGLVAVGGFFGYKAGLDYASDKLVDQVAKQVLTENEIENLLKDPEVRRLVEQGIDTTAIATTTPTPESESGGASGTTGALQESQPTEVQHQQPMFADKQEALQFLLSKFSMTEIREVMGMASGGLTEEEKEEIKALLLSRLTPEEYQALLITGLIEMKKQ